jgi:hypothetical protein
MVGNICAGSEIANHNVIQPLGLFISLIDGVCSDREVEVLVQLMVSEGASG